jgi:adenylate cyclase
LIDSYGAEDFRYLNFYGPPGTIRRIRFDDLLNQALHGRPVADLRGKVVFVGFSEKGPNNDVDHYSTPVSRSDQVDMSGVELGAVAFLNLLDGSSLHRANWRFVGCLVFILGFSLAAAARGLPAVLDIPGAVLICVGYVMGVVWYFGQQHVWLPLVTPIGLCVPLVAINSAVLRFIDVHLERERMFEAIRPFLPAGLLDQIRKNAAAIAPVSASLHGVCVATDAKQFTTLVESMPQEDLEKFMNGYYEALFTPVVSNGGVVSDTAGDAMIAVFPVRSHEPDVRAKAAVACLEILESTDRFNQTSEKGQLPTRIGVDFGAVTLAVLGTKARREYHAIGDPVNAASRLQELNKHLGTSLLVSDHVIANVSGLLTRDVGTYLLRGKRLPIHAHELRAAFASSTENDRRLCKRFGEALARLNYGDREGGEAALRALLPDYPGDGPTLFYLRRIRDGEPFPNDGMQVD